MEGVGRLYCVPLLGNCVDPLEAIRDKDGVAAGAIDTFDAFDT